MKLALALSYWWLFLISVISAIEVLLYMFACACVSCWLWSTGWPRPFKLSLLITDRMVSQLRFDTIHLWPLTSQSCAEKWAVSVAQYSVSGGAECIWWRQLVSSVGGFSDSSFFSSIRPFPTLYWTSRPKATRRCVIASRFILELNFSCLRSIANNGLAMNWVTLITSLALPYITSWVTMLSFPTPTRQPYIYD